MSERDAYTIEGVGLLIAMSVWSTSFVTPIYVETLGWVLFFIGIVYGFYQERQANE